MDPSLTEIIAAVTVVGTFTGGACKFLFDRVSARQTSLERRQEEERTRLEAERVRHELRLEQERLRWEKVQDDQITELRREVRLQEHQIGYLRTVSDAYLRHIAALEGLMRAAGIQIPALVLPVFPQLPDESAI